MSDKSNSERAIEYILKARGEGRSDDEIKWSLIERGWSKEAVDRLWQRLPPGVRISPEPSNRLVEGVRTEKCSRCGGKVYSNDTACMDCGLPLHRAKDEAVEKHDDPDQIWEVVSQGPEKPAVDCEAQHRSQDQPTSAPQNGKHLNTCIHCGNDISRDAESCPHCGAKLVVMSTSDWRHWGGCSGCGCQWWLAVIILGALADVTLFEGAGTVVIWVLIIGLGLAALDTVVKKITGRSLIERMTDQ